MKILITDGLSKEGLSLFESHKNIDLDVRKKIDREELKKIINNYEAVIIRSATSIDAEIIDLLGEGFKLIGRAGIGVDNVDIKAASKKGIIVMNTPSANAITTAEHTIALLFSLVRKTPQAHSSMKSLKWERSKFQGTELFGKTLGLIGMGNIGRLVAERAIGLRMKVIAHDPYILKGTNLNMPVELVDMDEVFKMSDVISVHTPLTSTTKNLISKGSIQMMKDGVFIINCARGGIVSEDDISEAISSGKVGGLALDVFNPEPPDFSSPVFKLEDNVVLTPHLGASTQEAQMKVGIAMAEQVIEFANDGVVSNAVNMPSMSNEVLNEISPYLNLCEKLGNFMGQTCKSGVKEIIVEYSGNVAETNVAPLTITALKGYLSPIMSAPVTYVNAPLIAEERGIKLTEAKVSTEDEFSSDVTNFFGLQKYLIEDELEGLLQWWHDPSPLHPFERAILFHHRFQQVRPFESGNGLVGRLILDGMLIRAGLSSTRWQKEDRSTYLSGLVAGDRGDRTKLIEIFWKAYKNQHRPSVEGGKESMRLSPQQSQLEAF